MLSIATESYLHDVSNINREACIDISSMHCQSWYRQQSSCLYLYIQGGCGIEEQEQALDEVAGKLSEAVVGLEKSNKVAEKVFYLASRVSDTSSLFQTTQEQLKTSMELADRTAADLAFLSKYKKTRDGAKLTIEVAQEMLAAAAGCLQSLLDGTKTMKALLPRASKAE